jgi:hypothetical protein
VTGEQNIEFRLAQCNRPSLAQRKPPPDEDGVQLHLHLMEEKILRCMHQPEITRNAVTTGGENQNATQ